MKHHLTLDGHSLKLHEVEEVSKQTRQVKLSSQANVEINASRKVVQRILAARQVVYGITTGFGKFKDTYICPDDSRQLQRNLILSHAAGLGQPLNTQTVRAMMLLRANALAKGFSGVRVELIELLLNCLNRGVHPIVPEQGSVGASGDLCPLAHLALVLIGEGMAEFEGRILPGSEALKSAQLNPIILEAKEGLALTNGTQLMAALATLLILEGERLCRIADIVAAMSLEALLGSVKPFAEDIQQVRPHPGQIAAATNLRLLTANSALVASHANCPLVQDAYSLRCIPQVHGASRQVFRHAREVLEIEINSATDNPLIFRDMVVSGGNFHGQPVALVMDYMALGLSELASISERRTERLVNPALSNGLPPFLTSLGGLNSGLMVAQYTAAALVSENKSLAHPASVDSIPTSANQEDHVSMGPIAGRKARQILTNAYHVLAIELLCAAQGLDYRLGKVSTDTGYILQTANDLEAGPGVQAAYELIRKEIPHLEHDRELHKDISLAHKLTTSGALLKAVEDSVGTLQ
ncbi:MAG: histidine ammonia-lyase [Candidatus Melainabacteria bacterium]|nr:histidine ammonia-lyase [Candidatus Melainabacteria bacterium]